MAMRAELVKLAATREVTQAAEEDFLVTQECAKLLHVTCPTLLKWGRTGKLPYVQLERKALWHWPSVKEALLRLQRNNGGAL
jgi:hypothetical protein